MGRLSRVVNPSFFYILNKLCEECGIMLELFNEGLFYGLGFWCSFFLIALVFGIVGMLVTGFDEYE